MVRQRRLVCGMNTRWSSFSPANDPATNSRAHQQCEERHEKKHTQKKKITNEFAIRWHTAIVSSQFRFPIHVGNPKPHILGGVRGWGASRKNDNNHFWLLTCAPNRTRERGRKTIAQWNLHYVWIVKLEGNGMAYTQVNGFESIVRRASNKWRKRKKTVFATREIAHTNRIFIYILRKCIIFFVSDEHVNVTAAYRRTTHTHGKRDTYHRRDRHPYGSVLNSRANLIAKSLK